MGDVNRPGSMPPLERQVRECRRLLAEFDEVPWSEMGAPFYQQAYEELRINLGLLLDIVESGPGEGTAITGT